ncbi:hypothetical protein ACSSV8_004033, partial [Roseovarius sp. MBR-79]
EIRKDKSGRLLRRPRQHYAAATVAEYCSADYRFQTCQGRPEATLTLQSLVDKVREAFASTKIGERGKTSIKQGVAQRAR